MVVATACDGDGSASSSTTCCTTSARRPSPAVEDSEEDDAEGAFPILKGFLAFCLPGWLLLNEVNQLDGVCVQRLHVNLDQRRTKFHPRSRLSSAKGSLVERYDCVSLIDCEGKEVLKLYCTRCYEFKSSLATSKISVQQKVDLVVVVNPKSELAEFMLQRLWHWAGLLLLLAPSLFLSWLMAMAHTGYIPYCTNV